MKIVEYNFSEHGESLMNFFKNSCITSFAHSWFRYLPNRRFLEHMINPYVSEQLEKCRIYMLYLDEEGDVVGWMACKEEKIFYMYVKYDYRGNGFCRMLKEYEFGSKNVLVEMGTRSMPKFLIYIK